ncbi:MAG: pyridoxamine 5'-phosphate oxidase family protein, partial [Myxococcota bacterium]
MAKWHDDLEVARIRHRRDPTGGYAQLATVDGSGRPRCRTVVVRDVDAARDTLAVVFDARSAKHQELRATPWVEMCWYFRKTREQFRLHGRAHTGDASVRDAFWRRLSDAARRTFSWPAPGAPRDETAAPDPDDATPPPSSS